MGDVLYQASVYLARKPAMELPGGFDVGASKHIQYHYYSVGSDTDAAFRIHRALGFIKESGVELPKAQAEQIIDLLLARIVSAGRHDPKTAAEIVSKAESDGVIRPSTRHTLAEASLPFRESPLLGKTITEIAKQHCDEKHLHRYLSEFEFRHNHRTKLGFSDTQRAQRAIAGIEGKRLTYRRTDGTPAA